MISGTLKYLANYSAAGFEAGGNFLALKVGSEDEVADVTYSVIVSDGESESEIELDESMNIVIQVEDPDAQTIIVKAEKEGYVSDSIELSLSGLELNPEVTE